MNGNGQDRQNDGSQRPPGLAVLQSWWGLIGVGGADGEWTADEKVERIAEAGFAGIMGRLPYPEEAGRWRKRLDAHGFRFGVHCFPYSGPELREFFAQIEDFGVDFVNAHIMDVAATGDAAIALIREMIEEAAGRGIPFFVETHRGRITQDLRRTAEYVAAIPELRLTIDVSHYAIAGEWEHPGDREARLLDPLLRRTSCIHGRISNGQQVQIDIGERGEHPLVPAYAGLWTTGMAYWLERAKPDELLPVLPELGPPPYAITADGSRNSRRELSDRWQQAVLIKQLLEQAWEAAVQRRNQNS